MKIWVFRSDKTNVSGIVAKTGLNLEICCILGLQQSSDFQKLNF